MTPWSLGGTHSGSDQADGIPLDKPLSDDTHELLVALAIGHRHDGSIGTDTISSSCAVAPDLLRYRGPREEDRVKLELRSGLIEVPGGLPTFASQGLEARALAIGGIAADSYDYLARLLGLRPEAHVLVLSEADWAAKNEVPLYGLPNAADGTLTVAGTEAPFWSEVGTMVAEADRAELEATYRTGDGSVKFGPFFDLIAGVPPRVGRAACSGIAGHPPHATAPWREGAPRGVRVPDGRRFRAHVQRDARSELCLVPVPAAGGCRGGLPSHGRTRGCPALQCFPAR